MNPDVNRYVKVQLKNKIRRIKTKRPYSHTCTNAIRFEKRWCTMREIYSEHLVHFCMLNS